MQIRGWILFSLVVACFIAPTAAKADTVVWTLNDAVFSEYNFYDSSLQGTFDYDADTSTYSDASVSLWSEGSYIAPMPIYSTTADSITFGISSNSTGLFTVVLGSPLTDAGGDVLLTGSSNDGHTLDPGAYLSAPGPATATPEPGTLLLVFSGLGGVMFRRRRRT